MEVTLLLGDSFCEGGLCFKDDFPNVENHHAILFFNTQGQHVSFIFFLLGGHLPYNKTTQIQFEVRHSVSPNRLGATESERCRFSRFSGRATQTPASSSLRTTGPFAQLGFASWGTRFRQRNNTEPACPVRPIVFFLLGASFLFFFFLGGGIE